MATADHSATPWLAATAVGCAGQLELPVALAGNGDRPAALVAVLVAQDLPDPPAFGQPLIALASIQCASAGLYRVQSPGIHDQLRCADQDAITIRRHRDAEAGSVRVVLLGKPAGVGVDDVAQGIRLGDGGVDHQATGGDGENQGHQGSKPGCGWIVHAESRNVVCRSLGNAGRSTTEHGGLQGRSAGVCVRSKRGRVEAWTTAIGCPDAAQAIMTRNPFIAVCRRQAPVADAAQRRTRLRPSCLARYSASSAAAISSSGCAGRASTPAQCRPTLIVSGMVWPSTVTTSPSTRSRSASARRWALSRSAEGSSTTN